MASAAAATAHADAGAGALCAHPAASAPTSWPERFVERREGARRFLAGQRTVPYLITSAMAIERQHAPNSWAVPGWRGTFDDHELIALAERLGWEG
jgi:hypothetical protein